MTHPVQGSGQTLQEDADTQGHQQFEIYTAVLLNAVILLENIDPREHTSTHNRLWRRVLPPRTHNQLPRGLITTHHSSHLVLEVWLQEVAYVHV